MNTDKQTMQVLSRCGLEGYPNSFPMSLFNEEQAQANHGQSLTRLNERGGLSPSEMVANIERRKWKEMPAEEALKKLMKYMEAKQADSPDNLQEERIGTATEFINRAIAMLKDEYQDEWYIAGYNGIVSLLGYAKSKIERMDARIKELESSIQASKEQEK